jgi:hypothetical protein
MFGTEQSKIALVDSQNSFNVEPFGHRHDGTIDKIYLTTKILCRAMPSFG